MKYSMRQSSRLFAEVAARARVYPSCANSKSRLEVCLCPAGTNFLGMHLDKRRGFPAFVCVPPNQKIQHTRCTT